MVQLQITLSGVLHFLGTTVGPWLLRQVREQLGAEIAVSALALLVILVAALLVRGVARWASQWGWAILWATTNVLYLGISIYVAFEPTRAVLHSLLTNGTAAANVPTL